MLLPSMKKIIFLIFFCFSSSLWAEAKYTDKKLLLDKKWSIMTGANLSWLSGCGEKKYKSKQMKAIKALSKADYKKVNQGVAKALGTGNKYSVGCDSNSINETKGWIDNYVAKLTKEVNYVLTGNYSDPSITETKKSNSSSTYASPEKYIRLQYETIDEICQYMDCWDAFIDDYYLYFYYGKNKFMAIAYKNKITDYISGYGWSAEETNKTYARNKALDICNDYKDATDRCYVIFENNQIVHEDLIKFLSNQSISNTTNTESSNTIEEKLTRLKSLFDKELITKEEYDYKRQEILNEM